MTDDEDVVARADDLDMRISDKTIQVVDELVSYRKISKRIQWLLAFAIVVLLAVIMVQFVIIRSVQHNSTSITASCEQINESNANQTKLWKFILDIPPSSPQTDEQKKNREVFTKLIADTFKQRKCPHGKV